MTDDRFECGEVREVAFGLINDRLFGLAMKQVRPVTRLRGFAPVKRQFGLLGLR